MNTSSKQQLLMNINIVDFVVTDLREYLDTHPYDKEAMNYYTRYEKMLHDLKADYTNKYTPLNENHQGYLSDCWKWALDPMPWEGGTR